jgi:hypothetical protein
MGNLIHYMDASTLSWLKIWCSRSKLEPLIYSLFMTALLHLRASATDENANSIKFPINLLINLLTNCIRSSFRILKNTTRLKRSEAKR